MLNARRYECLSVEPTERWAYAGNTSGQISVIDVSLWAVVRDHQAHLGTVRAIMVHPSLPYLAALGTDRCVSLWRRFDDGRLEPLAAVSIRDVGCSNDEFGVPPIMSHSMALGFHPAERRLVTRSGNGGVLEMAFDDAGRTEVLSCVRLHGAWDVQFARYLPDGEAVLSGGRDGCLVLSESGSELRRWTFGSAAVHWAEPVEDLIYLVASDEGRVIRVDLASDDPARYGRRFALDDMEYVAYNRASRRAFATSFDRRVHEIDPETGDSVGVAFVPGYKTLWAHSLERDPSVLLVQSSNGGLYKADVDTGEQLALVKETPEALWSGVSLGGGDLLLAGEGNRLVRLCYRSTDPISRTPRFEIRTQRLDIPSGTYTKRMVRQASSGRLVLGRTDGEIWTGTEGGVRRVASLGSAVRDLVVMPSGDTCFAVTEDGRVLALDLGSGEVRTRYQSSGSPFPLAIWAVAYNHVADLLAFACHGGELHLVRGADFAPVASFTCGRTKRLKWVDADTLLIGWSDEVHRYSVSEGICRPVVTTMQNTVEDFIWDNMRRYLVVICYMTTIALADFETGEKLDLVRDQLDYSKGLMWLDPTPDPQLYPYDFVTWGRSGDVHQFRIHDEQIVALGPVGVPLD